MPSHGSLTKTGRNKKRREFRMVQGEHGHMKPMMHKRKHDHPALRNKKRYFKHLKNQEFKYKEPRI